MRDEIASAVVFISRLLKRNRNLSTDQVDKFSDQLSAILLEKFKNHWHTEDPLKGQGYRCIRVNECEPVDPVLLRAAQNSGIDFYELDLPLELTLWVDPSEVSCRFGETKSSYYTVACVKDGKLDNRACKLDLEDLIGEHLRKKAEDMNKLKEYTERNSPSLYESHDMILHYQPSGEVHMPVMGVGGLSMGSYGGARWGPPKGYYSNGHMRRSSPSDIITSSPSVSRNRSPLTLDSHTDTASPVNGMSALNVGRSLANGSMKTGHRHTPSPHGKHQWTNKINASAPAAKA